MARINEEQGAGSKETLFVEALWGTSKTQKIKSFVKNAIFLFGKRFKITTKLSGEPPKLKKIKSW